MCLPVGNSSWNSFFMAVAAQILASAVTPEVSAPRSGLLFVAVCVVCGGEGFMAVVSSMVFKIRFHGVFGPQFMIDIEVGSSVTSSLIMTVRGFMFAVKRRWLSIDRMKISSCGSGWRRVTLRTVQWNPGSPYWIIVTWIGRSNLSKKKAVFPSFNFIAFGLIRVEVSCRLRLPLSRMVIMS